MKIFYGILTGGGYLISKKIINNRIRKEIYKGIFIKDTKGYLYKSNPNDKLIKFENFEVQDFRDVYYKMKRDNNIYLPLTTCNYVKYVNIDRELFVIDLYFLKYISKNKENLEKLMGKRIFIFFIVLFTLLIFTVKKY